MHTIRNQLHSAGNLKQDELYCIAPEEQDEQMICMHKGSKQLTSTE